MAAMLFAPARHLKAQEAAPAATSGVDHSSPEAESVQADKREAQENAEYLHSPAVRALGAKLGMNPEQAATAFTVANFVVLALLVGWFLIRQLPKTFQGRNSTIQKHLVDARTATEEAHARLSSVEDRKQIQQYAAELAIDQAARKLVVTAETDRLLIQSFARRLAGDESKEGHN